MDIFSFLVSSAGGYFTNHFLTNPESRVKNKLPKIKFKWLQISPNIKIYATNNKHIHLHHWMNFSIILIISFTYGGYYLEAISLKGFLVGGILQGVTYPDWRKILRENKQS